MKNPPLSLLFGALILLAQVTAPLAFAAGKTADVYIFSGQSNSSGTGMGPQTLPEELKTTFKKTQIWAPLGNERKGGFEPLQPGVNSDPYTNFWAQESQIAYRLEN